jgi:hypothetical protein
MNTESSILKLIEDNNRLRKRVAELEKSYADSRQRECVLEHELTAVIGEIQHLQPPGSPPPGGSIDLVRWIVREAHQAVDFYRLYQDHAVGKPMITIGT